MPQSSYSMRHWRWSGCFFAALLCGAAAVWLWPVQETPAELTGPRSNDRYITQMVAVLLEKHHLSKRPLDDTIARRGLEMFLKTLDPAKIYLRQQDVDEFRQSRDQLDDMLKRGDVSFSYKVFQRYLKRMDERVGRVDEVVKTDFDYTKDEQWVTDPKQINYATTEAEANDRWRRRIKYELMVRRADDEKEDEARANIARRYKNFAKRTHQTDSSELLEMYLTSFTSSYDPHTTYMSADTLENFHINMRLNLEGIGAALQIKDGYTVVTKIIPGGAADKMGKLMPEDRIVSVGQGDEGEMVDVVDMKLSDVVHLIRGKAGTVVRLGVIPSASSDKQTYKITRARIELKDSEARGVVLPESGGQDGIEWKIGVIDLPSFYQDMEAAKHHDPNAKSTSHDVLRILKDFKRQRVDALILDLRRNGGGSLREAIDLTGLFIDQGPVVQVKDSAGRVEQYDDSNGIVRGMAWDGPLVVLTSKFSASASEILAGAIQDYSRGIVVGDESTHGKGTVQSLLDLGQQLYRREDAPKLGALKITMQQFYRPKGDSTQKQGVPADVALPSLTSHMDVGESDLDYALPFDQIKSALGQQDTFGMVNPDILAKLRSQSEQRCSESEDFRKLAENIQRYVEQKRRTSVTLNEKQFLADRKGWDADKEEEKELHDQFDIDRPVFDRDFYYNREVLAVTIDYLRLLGNQAIAQAGRAKTGRAGS